MLAIDEIQPKNEKKYLLQRKRLQHGGEKPAIREAVQSKQCTTKTNLREKFPKKKVKHPKTTHIFTYFIRNNILIVIFIKKFYNILKTVVENIK